MLAERREGSDRFRVLVAPENPSELVQVMADPGIKIIALTVAKKGYCQDNPKGKSRLNHPNIRADLKAIDKPRLAIGVLASAAKVRTELDRGSFWKCSTSGKPQRLSIRPGGLIWAPTPNNCASVSQNPALKHRTWQIAINGSRKLPGRWLEGRGKLTRPAKGGGIGLNQSPRRKSPQSSPP